MDNVFQWALTHPVYVHPRKSRFTGRDGRCERPLRPQVYLQVEAFESERFGGIQRLKELVWRYGPVVVAVNAERRDTEEGYIVCGGAAAHSVTIVGYSGDVFMIKNSWGTTWGNKGFAKLNTRECKLGTIHYVTRAHLRS